VWTWTAIDADTKLMVSYFVGDRSGESAMVLMDDLRARLANRVQLTTGGHRASLGIISAVSKYGLLDGAIECVYARKRIADNVP
jgi:hypothetical protein